MSLNSLTLDKTLFYLSILQNEQQNISDQSINSISIGIYGFILHENRKIMIQDLKDHLNDLLENTNRTEFNFGITAETFPSINPKYYGRTLYFRISSDNNDLYIEATIRS